MTTTMTESRTSNFAGDDRGSGFSRTLTVLIVWFFGALWLGVRAPVPPKDRPSCSPRR